MDQESPASRKKAAIDRDNPDTAPHLPEAQFTTRDLRLIKRLVATFVAIGFAVAGHWLAALILALIIIPTLFVGDWLIRPAHRDALAIVVACSWIALACGLATGAFAMIYYKFAGRSGAPGWMIVAFLLVVSTACFVMAAKRWREGSGQRRTNL